VTARHAHIILTELDGSENSEEPTDQDDVVLPIPLTPSPASSHHEYEGDEPEPEPEPVVGEPAEENSWERPLPSWKRKPIL
jgi:hypothetical protein